MLSLVEISDRGQIRSLKRFTSCLSFSHKDSEIDQETALKSLARFKYRHIYSWSLQTASCE